MNRTLESPPRSKVLLPLPETKDVTRRQFLVGTVGLLALGTAACGNDRSGEGSSGETRTVRHAMGESNVPANPERVVVLDTGELDSAITLGVRPVGSVEVVQGAGFPSYLEGTNGIEKVGAIEQPSLERIAALEPNLILSSKVRHEQIYDQLSEIAPAVFTETTGVTWKENFLKHAEALGKAGESERIVREYEERVEELRRELGDAGEIEVSVVRFVPGQIRVYQKESFVGTVLEDTGLGRPPAQDKEGFAIGVDAGTSGGPGAGASRERIDTFDGDVLFYTAYGPAGETPLPEVIGGPLWNELDAVRQDNVYEVSDDLWMLGIGYTAARGVLDDLEKRLT